MLKTILGLVVALGLTGQTIACDIHGKSGYMPENDMYISTDAKVKNDMTEKLFNEIIDKVVDVYKPIVRKKWGTLKVNRRWKDGTVNASAQRLGPVYLLNMYGGLARHEAVTPDAFALVVCHELGHHLGGAPKNSIPMSWASNEGQADYFGNLKCFRRVFGDDDNVAIVSDMKVDSYVSEQCRKVWTNADEIALCERANMAGKSLAKLLGNGRAVNFKTPDPAVVDRTYNRHPAAQCRLDTYFKATLCHISEMEDVSRRDPNKGTCNRNDGHTEGLRPLCWYKPKS